MSHTVIKYIRGSHLYGTNVATSDIDKGGIYMVPNEAWMGLIQPQGETSDAKHDECFYELRKFFSLAVTANPTVMEALFVPEKFILEKSPVYDELVKHADMFITSKCKFSYSGYAYAQIKKAKGQNKKVHQIKERVNEKGIEKLRNMLVTGEVTADLVSHLFCKNLMLFLFKGQNEPSVKTEYSPGMRYRILDDPDIASMLPKKREEYCYTFESTTNLMPSRGIRLEDISDIEVSSVEHMPNLYRMYRSIEPTKTFFNDGEVVCSSIPIERERTAYLGLVYYNAGAYEREHKNYLSFWEWMVEKNEARWVTQASGEMSYDAKNMAHTVRLLLEAEHIAEHGRPIIHFTGADRDFLLNIRNGKYSYEYLLQMAEDKCEALNEKFDKSGLPHSVNMKKINELYKTLIGMTVKGE